MPDLRPIHLTAAPPGMVAIYDQPDDNTPGRGLPVIAIALVEEVAYTSAGIVSTATASYTRRRTRMVEVVLWGGRMTLVDEVPGFIEVIQT